MVFGKARMPRLLEWNEYSNTAAIWITREPTLKIICPYDYSRKRFGLFPDGCPNLLWELMRTRREQLTASQLMRKNPTEAIVDKDNHLMGQQAKRGPPMKKEIRFLLHH